jgi:hypothetical protein
MLSGRFRCPTCRCGCHLKQVTILVIIESAAPDRDNRVGFGQGAQGVIGALGAIGVHRRRIEHQVADLVVGMALVVRPLPSATLATNASDPSIVVL